MMRDFRKSDLYDLEAQEAQAGYKEHVMHACELNALGETYTYTEDGKVKAIIGAQEYWSGRATVWALIGKIRSWARFHKEVCATLEGYAKRTNLFRLEMTTEEGFIESERWAKMLGFKYESTMLKYDINQNNHKMWVKLWQHYQ